MKTFLSLLKGREFFSLKTDKGHNSVFVRHKGTLVNYLKPGTSLQSIAFNI